MGFAARRWGIRTLHFSPRDDAARQQVANVREGESLGAFGQSVSAAAEQRSRYPARLSYPRERIGPSPSAPRPRSSGPFFLGLVEFAVRP